MVTIAILPVKRFELAKQRLGGALEPAQRRVLARAMVSDVLEALAACPDLDATLVVTREPAIARLASDHGAEVVGDRAESGQSDAARAGLSRALALGATRALLIPGDCPALDRDDVAALLSPTPTEPSVTIVPDRHGTGTNALLLSPPGVLDPAFGPGSFERHLKRAQAANAHVSIQRPASLTHDVDTAEDLSVLRGLLDARGRTGSHTRRALTAMDR